MNRGPLGLAALAAVLGTLASATTAAAAPGDPSWNCRASVIREITPLQRLEPLVANGDPTTGGDRPACAPDLEGAPTITLPDALAPLVAPTADVVRSETTLTPAGGNARDETATAGAYADSATISVGGGALVVGVEDLRADASGHCVDGQPAIDGSSHIDRLSINGNELSLQDNGFFEITNQINDSPLGQLLRIVANDKVVTPEGVTVQALRVEVLAAAGDTPLATVVLGEARVTAQGLACAPEAPPPPPEPPVTTTTTVEAPGPATTTTTTTTAPAAPAAPDSGVTGSGTPVAPRKVVVNGSNGGCGKVAMWFSKTTNRGTLKGHPRSGTSRYGTRVVLRGVLRSCSGKAISGARLDVVHKVRGKDYVKTGLKSRSGGALTLILPMNLATRTISIRYRGDLNSKKITSKQLLRLTVKDGKGKVLTKAPPKTGKKTLA